MSRAAYRNLLKATFTQDAETVDRISAELGDVPWKDSGLLVAALFSLAIRGRFARDASPAAVRAFVTEARDDYAEVDQPIKPLIAEGVVRAALGEEDMLDEVPPLEGMQVQMALTHKILLEAEATGEQIDRMLDQAEALLDESL